MKNKKLIIFLRWITLIPLLPILSVMGIVALIEITVLSLCYEFRKKFEGSWVAKGLNKYISFFEKILK